MPQTDRRSDQTPRVLDFLFFGLLQIVPHHPLSRVMMRLTRIRWAPFKNWLIRRFIKLYDVDMSLAENADPDGYGDFNAFFTRALYQDARPLAADPSAVTCPSDGMVSQLGKIEGADIFQAKGLSYTLDELLAGAAWAEDFRDGGFITIYLSPRDYHRVHTPAEGHLSEMRYVPGRLFSVSPSTTRVIPRLFARNERIVSLFETDAGRMAVIMVGAIFVASMDTVWEGTVTPGAGNRVRITSYDQAGEPGPSLEKGQELGRFNMGSTVVLLFERDRVKWNEDLAPGDRVRVGEQIAAKRT